MLVKNILGIGLLLAASVAAQTPESLMGAALHQERVTGNLQGAIDGYRKVLAAKGTPRALAAQAQYHIGLCYEKLSNQEARKAFETVVRNYGDQKELVAQARLRLGAMGSGTGEVRTRLLWDNALDDWGSASTDGRYLSFVDWNESRVDIRDLATGQNLRIFDKGGPAKGKGEPGGNAISPDGKRVAFAYLRYDRPRTEWEYDELHVMNSDGSGHRVLLSGGGLDYIEPFSWSPDGKWIACGLNYKDKRPTPIALVSAQDGQMRLLPSESTEFKRNITFSPDGKWLAYSHGLRATAVSLFVKAADDTSTRETKLAQDAHVMGWAPDGSAILFSRSRLGAHHLYLLPFSQGKAAAEPQAVYTTSDVGANSLCVTAQGTLLFGTSNRRADAVVYAFSNGAPVSASAMSLLPVSGEVNSLLSGGSIQFSPDGRKLLAVTAAGTIAIRDAATGAERTLSPRARSLFRIAWGPDSESILIAELAAIGKFSIVRAPISGGSETTLAELDSNSMGIALSKDGKTLFHGGPREVFTRDLGTGVTKRIWNKGISGPFQLKLSHDGSRLAIRAGRYLGIVDLATGNTTDLQADSPDGERGGLLWAMDWSADDASLLTIAKIGTGLDRMELWTFPASGGTPSKQAIAKELRGLSLSPDGKHLATTLLTRREQVWALENFLPAKK